MGAGIYVGENELKKEPEMKKVHYDLNSLRYHSNKAFPRIMPHTFLLSKSTF